MTGGGIRVGRAIVGALLERGVRVAIHYHRSEQGAREAAAQAGRLGIEAPVLQADLSEAAEAERLASRAADALGGLDILVNSAAIMERRPLEEISPRDWDRTMNLNLRGAFFVAKGAAAVMKGSGGVIINISDLAAFERWVGYPAHVISKAGVVVMTELLAKALAPSIRVNAVAPGAVLPPGDWDQAARRRLVESTPLRRLGAPEDVAAAVLYLLENDYVTGQTLVVDGGRRIR